MDTAGIVVFADRFRSRHWEAGAYTGFGNPHLRPSSRLPSFVFRPSSFVSRSSSLVPRKPRGISRGPQPSGRWGRIPRPYSPEYGAAPFGRCLKIPAKRPSQIETICFDLKRRSHRAIRSFHSITVLRKRSEQRALRRGSLWRISFASFFVRNKERGPPEATGRGSEPQRRAANT